MQIKKKNILVILLSLEIGGMEQLVSDLIISLNKDRYNIKVLCIHTLGPIAEELKVHGIVVKKIEAMIPLVSFLFPYSIIKEIREFNTDIIHVHSGCWHKAAMAGWLSGINKIIYTEHGRYYPESNKLVLLDKLFSRITSNIVTVSQNLATYMHEVVGIREDKISVILNGINVEKFVQSRNLIRLEARRVGIIARLAPVKDIGTLLRAMRIVIDKFPDVELDIVGDGPERTPLEDLTKELNLANSVKFLGFRRDIAEILLPLDIFVLSSISEGTSITLLEAMAAGKPVVVTNVGGNPAIIDNGVNGFLVPPRDPERMADAIIRLIEESETGRKMGEANIRKVENKFSIHAMARQYEQVYDS